VTGWGHTQESVSSLPTIQEAVWQERRLRFTYQRGGDCEDIERVCDPLGLVAKGSAWYLVAAVDDDVRSYRISRIKDPLITDEPSVRPGEFDLAQYWEQSTAKFKATLPRYQTTVRAAPEIIPRMPYAGRFARVEHVGPPDADGWSKVSLRFDVEEMACQYVLGFGPQIEVIEPEGLAEKVVRMAESVIEFYARKDRKAASV
jgi:predicted DNA-binding transcriptional regulator YafY